ncbi:MAG: WXG100 family type VII secretion target [Pseudoclavibacter sp.]
MYGANTAALRVIAGRFGQRSDGVQAVATTTLGEVNGVEWLGQDAEQYRDDYDHRVVTELKALAIVLENREKELFRQADEQDEASGAGRFGSPGFPGPFEKIPFFPDILKGVDPRNWLHLYPDIRNPLRGLRFLMEAGYAITHPGVFGKFFTTGWQGITGYVPGWGKTGAGIEAALEASRAGFLYKPLKWTTDMLQAKPLSVFLENKIAGLVDRTLGLKPFQHFVTGADGVTDISKLSRTSDAIQSFLGKEGRLLGRGLGGFAVGMDGFAAYQHFSNGDVGAGAWSTTKAVLGAASFIPGPVGWTAAGISVGIAAYENIPVVRDTVNAAANGVKDGALWVGDKVSQGWNAINPFD